MIQGKSHHAKSRAKTRKASAAQNRIQGKTTLGNQLHGTTRSARSQAKALAVNRFSPCYLQASWFGNSSAGEALHEQPYPCRTSVA